MLSGVVFAVVIYLIIEPIQTNYVHSLLGAVFAMVMYFNHRITYVHKSRAFSFRCHFRHGDVL